MHNKLSCMNILVYSYSLCGLKETVGLSPLEEMHRKLCISASGNAKRMLHLRFAEMQADVCSTASGTAHKTV